ncbi:MAG: alcohol dehydrogenase catalytic domain-containing protein [Pirellulales bacterium]
MSQSLGTYRAAVFDAEGRVRIVEVPRRPLTPVEARVQVQLAGICGTDLALRRRHLPTRIPPTFGHEFVGRVIEVGHPSHDRWLDQQVGADINLACTDRPWQTYCDECRSEDRHHCPRRTVLGIDVTDGAFAEELIVPVQNLIEIPASVDPRRAVFTEPLAAALHAFTASPIGPEQTVLVLGAGRLGALIGRVAELQGARVISVTQSDRRHERLKNFGLTNVLSRRDSDIDACVRDATRSIGADVVVEVTGQPQGIVDALRWVRPRGRVVLKSTCGLPASGFDQTAVVVQEIQLIGSRCGDYHAAVEWLDSGRIEPERLIEASYPLDAINTALDAAQSHLKVLVELHPTARLA